MKKILVYALMLLLPVLCLSACGGKTEGGEEPKSTSETPADKPAADESFISTCTLESARKITEFENHIKLLGRTSFCQYGQNVDYPASGFAMTVETEGTDFAVSYNVEKKVYFASFIDGEEGERFEVTGKGTMTIKVPAGTHEVTVVRDGETKEGSQSLLTAVAFNGTVGPVPADKKLYIEIIGDSIVSGNGTLTKDNAPGVIWDASDNSATHAFGWMTAKALDADLSVVGRGSIGLVKEVADSEGKKFAMPELYKYTTGLSTFTREEFDFAGARTPDVIILEVSTNDRSSVSGEAFTSAATDFLKEIRTLYGKDIPIVWIYDLMIEDNHEKELLKVVSDLGGEEKGFYSLKLVPGQDGGRGTAEGTCHPSYENHQTNTELIVKFLKEKGLAE